MLQKPFEYWAVLAGMVLYAATRDAERESLWRRLVKVVASAFLTVGLTPNGAPYLQGSETMAAVCVMAFGLLALDVASGLVGDRALIRDILRKRLFAKLPDVPEIHDLAARYGQALEEATKSKVIARGAEALADEIVHT